MQRAGGSVRAAAGRLAVLGGLFLALSLLPGARADGSLWTAYINFTYTRDNYTRSEGGEMAVFGQDSPKRGAEGLLLVAEDPAHTACTPVNFSSPAEGVQWLALIQRGGGCTFSQKILRAAAKGAAGVVIYNYGRDNDVIAMSHPDTEDTVAIMIGSIKGKEILSLIEKGIQVTMVIEVAKRHGPMMNHYSIFFVSVSFFIVTAATVGYFIFYSARRLRMTRAQTQKLKKLKADAKKAIGHLQLRTLKQGEMEVGPDGDSCAVCIDNYKPNDVVRILTCNHFFHKTCIDPWLLEHRTCPMCKCDILKALGVEEDIEEGHTETGHDQVANETPTVTAQELVPAQTEEDTRSETASSGYASVRGSDETSAKEESAATERTYDNVQLVKNESNALEIDVLPHLDNPSFEDEEESHRRELKS